MLLSELSTVDCKLNHLPIVCVTDNHSLFDVVKSTKSVIEKRLHLEISSVKETIHHGTIQ